MERRWHPTLGRPAVTLVALVILSLSTSGFAQAGLVMFKFSGLVDNADTALSPTIARDTPFTGSYGYESTTRNWEAEPGVGVYPLSHFSMEISGKHYSFDPNGSGFNGPASLGINRSYTLLDDGISYQLHPHASYYGIDINSLVGDPVNGLTPLADFGFNISLLNGRYIFSEGSDLLTPPLLMTPSLGNFLGNNVRLSFSYPSGVSVDAIGHLTSLTLSPVPLPGSLLLFGSSLLGLAGLRLYRRRVTA